MKLINIWWCRECDMEITDTLSHAQANPNHTYIQMMRTNIRNAYGLFRDSEESLDEEYTTSSDFKTKLKMVKGPNLPPGTYKIEWYCEVDSNLDEAYTEFRVYQDQKILSDVDCYDTNTWLPCSGFAYINFNNDNKVFEMKWRSSDGRSTAGIRNARFTFWRLT